MKTELIENRQLRIFISSTFRDMMAERDYLVKKVFPALRRYGEERDVSIVEIDLRWGISEEESTQGKVVDICLKEIQKTTPFFIGLLGERYGWTPSQEEQHIIAANTPVFEDYPWVRDELNRGTSITEIEIQEGVLRSPEKLNAYFYFRSAKMEVEDSFKEKSGSPEALKLQTLKKTLRSQQDYPVQDYDSIEHLGDLVERDFKALVDRLFPQGVLSSLEKERLEQQTFLKSRIGVYVPNPGWLEKLDGFVQSEERSMVITGESGMGKSALIANWIVKRGNPPNEKILYHFIGNSRAEGDYRKITGRLINEIRALYNLPAEQKAEWLAEKSADGADKEQEILQNLLFALPQQERLVVVLDGMNRLFDIDNAKLLNWFPAFPPNVKFIFSTNPQDSTCEVFTRRQYNIFPVEALPPESRKRLIAEYLKSFGKGLTPARIERIVMDKKSENPLVLRTLLDELRVFGIHEKVDSEIDRYFAAPDLDNFFALVLERLEKTYAVGDYNLLRDVFCLIAVSRAGLSEPEILELSGAKPLYWSQLFNAVTGHVTIQNGLVGFSHGFIQEAVWKGYLSQGMERPYRRRIAAAMEASPLQSRRYDELPYQLFALEEWDTLYAFLVDFDAFEYINKKDEYELGKYWRGLRKADAETYTLRKYLDLETNGKSKEEVAVLYNNIGHTVEKALGDYPTALEYIRQALEIRETVLGKNHPHTATSYNNIGSMYDFLGKYSEALKYHKQALEIRETVLGKNHSDTATSYNNIGSGYYSLGEYPEALKYHKQALEIREMVLGKNHPHTATSYNNIGLVYNSLGDYPEALKYHKQALEILEMVLVKNHPHTATSYNNIGLVYDSLGDYPEALKYHKQALEILEMVLGKNHPHTATSYNNIGLVYNSLGDYPEALKYHKQALEIREMVLGKNHSDTATSYNNIGSMYDFLGKYSEALKYHKQALEIRETVLGKNHPHTATSYNNIGSVYNSLGDYPEALKYHKQALEILEMVLGKNHPHTATSYNNIGSGYYSLGEYPEALKYHKQALEIQEMVLGKNHPHTATSYNNIGLVYNSLGDYPEALKYHKQALEIQEMVLGKNHPHTATSYNNIGLVYNSLGDYPEALKYHWKFRKWSWGKIIPIRQLLTTISVLFTSLWGSIPKRWSIMKRRWKFRKRPWEKTILIR